MSGSVHCDLCRAKFPASEFDGGGAVVLLGRKVCSACVQKNTQYCSFCRIPVSAQDFEEGKAVTLLGRRYCEKCMMAAVERSKPADASGSQAGRPIEVNRTPAPVPSARALVSEVPSGAQARMFERFVPPREARLHIRAGGLEGLLGKNRVRTWLDLSEGGVRAIVKGACQVGDEIEAEIRYAPLKARYSVVLKVRHVHPSKSLPDCAVVGFKFVDADRDLRHLIHAEMRKFPLMAEMEAAPPAPAETKAPTPKAG